MKDYNYIVMNKTHSQGTFFTLLRNFQKRRLELARDGLTPEHEKNVCRKTNNKKNVFNISNQRHNQLIIAFTVINEVLWASECRKGHESMLLAKQLCYCCGEYIPLNVTYMVQANVNLMVSLKYKKIGPINPHLQRYLVICLMFNLDDLKCQTDRSILLNFKYLSSPITGKKNHCEF